MDTPNFKRTKLASYSAYFTMSSVFSLPPILFITFHDMYGVSYTLLGTLVLANFLTQMTVDLIFTFFTKYFNIHKVVRVMPLITSFGLAFYALSPVLFPNSIYTGLLIGTIIFSISAGLSEVMLSPVIAAIPSDDPQRDMSMLHSLYAFGVFTVVTLSTAFIAVFGSENWMYLTFFFAATPIISAVLFFFSPMPDMSVGSTNDGTSGTKRRMIGLALCVGCIFFGSCAENVMSNWVSSYLENALGLSKVFGDLLGMAVFAILLGLTRIAYARYAKHICAVLLIGMIGAACCYITAGIVPNSIVALVACGLTGAFTAMLWPGALIMMEENLPGVGVAAYALMASSGDLGASIAPQLMGYVVDSVSVSSFAAEISAATGLAAEQIGLKTGMLVSSLFPIVGAVLMVVIIGYFRKCRLK